MSANRFLRRILEWEPKGNVKEGKIERRWIGLRRCMNKRRLKEEDIKEMDMKRILALAKGNRCTLDSSGTNDKSQRKEVPIKNLFYRNR